MSNAFQPQMIQNSLIADSTAVDNATATATAAAIDGARHYVAGVIAQFSVAVAAIKNITITYTPEGTTSAVSLVIPWDFSKAFPAIIALPGIVHGKYNTAVTAALGASGTGGTTGRVYLFYSVM
jgi:hypothetical protein